MRQSHQWHHWPLVRCDQWGRRLERWPNTAASLAGWRRVTRQVWFCALYGRASTSCLFRTIPVALTGAAQLRADGISSCSYIVNVNNHASWATSCKEGMAWYSSRPMLSLWSILCVRTVLDEWYWLLISKNDRNPSLLDWKCQNISIYMSEKYILHVSRVAVPVSS